MKAAIAAVVAALSGGLTRLVLALHGGLRAWPLLVIEAALGATLGLIAAGAAVYLDPGLRDAGWALLVVTAAAGAAGALGTRLMDLLVAVVQRRLGI